MWRRYRRAGDVIDGSNPSRTAAAGDPEPTRDILERGLSGGITSFETRARRVDGDARGLRNATIYEATRRERKRHCNRRR